MGFPDTFRIPVSDTQAYRQFGNSVVMPVMREVARIMLPHVHAAVSGASGASSEAAPDTSSVLENAVPLAPPSRLPIHAQVA
jgi:DNA (cytosine-5)-methyltransferase 1